jgi:hypothetical protein
MNEVSWYDTVAADQEGFRRIVGTRGAFRAILHTMMPPSFIVEFFGPREVLS